jgi:hypothetical protein
LQPRWILADTWDGGLAFSIWIKVMNKRGPISAEEKAVSFTSQIHLEVAG